MRIFFFGVLIAGAALIFADRTAARGQQAGAAPAAGQSQGQGQGQGQGGRRGRGMGGFLGGGQGVLGSVTEVAADHYTIKTDAGETYIVHFSPNTRIVKQGARQGQGRRQAGGDDADTSEQRQPPQSLKPTDIKVGDFITAGGEMDSAAKSIGAVFIVQVDPERAKQMREMQANYGKTWLAGRITAINDTTITIDGIVDHAPHSVVVDENTSFRQRRDSITLADIKPGEQLRAEGAMKGGVFVATTVTAMQPPNRDQAPGAAGSSGSPAKPQ